MWITCKIINVKTQLDTSSCQLTQMTRIARMEQVTGMNDANSQCNQRTNHFIRLFLRVEKLDLRECDAQME